jgi:DNA polymerase-4
VIMHVDLDAFFAAVEQRDKPSLAGRPVVVGGLGSRGVVATASYEARAFGVRSAMPTAQARTRCPGAAFLAPRMSAYRETSAQIMRILAAHTETLEPVSLDEAYLVTTGGSGVGEDSSARAAAVGRTIRREIRTHTGLAASVGAARNKLMAKIASELAKPDGLRVVEPDEETDVLSPLPVRALPGVGPATESVLTSIGVRTVADLAAIDPADLVGLLGQAHGLGLSRLAHGDDDRTLQPDRAARSISAEDTFETDVYDMHVAADLVDRLADRVLARLTAHGLGARTVTVKARTTAFVTLTRSATLAAATEEASHIKATAARLLNEMPVRDGLRLVGVGVSSLEPWRQGTLFGPEPLDETGQVVPRPPARSVAPASQRPYLPGEDVEHAIHGRGWVWGTGLGRVTVRFETPGSEPGPVRTVAEDGNLWRVPLGASPFGPAAGSFES